MENEYEFLFKREEIWLWIQRAKGKAAKASNVSQELSIAIAETMVAFNALYEERITNVNTCSNSKID